MIESKTIESFCAKKSIRNSLLRPFNIGEFTYSTDGHVLLRIDSRPEYATNPPLQSVLDLEIKLYPDDLYSSIPDISLKDSVCPDCNGSGSGSECPDCEGCGDVSWESDHGYEYEDTCQMCSGSGIIKGPCDICEGTGKIIKQEYVEIGTKLFDPRFLLLIKSLPNCKIATEAVPDLKAVPFKCAGGLGIIMPVRKEGNLIYESQKNQERAKAQHIGVVP